MFNYILRKKNKQLKDPKVSYKKYIATTSDSEYHIPVGLTEKEVDDDMRDSLSVMKRQFKRTSKRLMRLHPRSV